VEFNHDQSTDHIWLSLYFEAADLSRLGVTHAKLLKESRLGTTFHEVGCDRYIDTRKLIVFEQTHPHTYSGRPADTIASLVELVRPFLWKTVNSDPPYRRYYAYLAPMVEQAEVLPQPLSIYALMFYLGSVVRYRPHHFDEILGSAYGSRVEEFISGIPGQFIYMMASEFARCEVTRPSVV
jgi:hypothetical protein